MGHWVALVEMDFKDLNKQNTMQETCSNCVYYQRGGCHIYPPEIVVAKDGAIVSMFPPVPPDETCGEWLSGDNNESGDANHSAAVFYVICSVVGVVIGTVLAYFIHR